MRCAANDRLGRAVAYGIGAHARPGIMGLTQLTQRRVRA
jgi:hypothetical protein